MSPDSVELVHRLASRTVGLVEREYPNSIRLSLTRPPDRIITPRTLYPAFYGCYDWHSSVHSHWQLVRAMRTLPSSPFTRDAADVLDRTLTPDNIAIEMEWLGERLDFEMPYGMAWLLKLGDELGSWDDDRARHWHSVLQPMITHAAQRFRHYCNALTVPVRGGLHNQSAFSLGLVWDAADDLRDVISDAATRFFAQDTDADLRHEPSASDFLSPALCEADLMRRVLPPDEFVGWLDRFAPDAFEQLHPVQVVDASNGQLAHWAGLNLSRAWMLRSIAAALPHEHPAGDRLRTSATDHIAAGLANSDHDDYMISHWVPTFAVYLLTDPETTHLEA